MQDALAEVIGDQARLEALRRTALLDSAPEEAFDRLTRVATAVLRVPVALVTLLDSNRHFFKSQFGLTEPLATARETPLTHSFCKHVVGGREPLVVHDVRTHPLFRDPPPPEGSVRSYAGIPLITAEGHALGTFCVIDWRPREWSEGEIDILRVLAASTMSEIDLRRVAGDLRALTSSLQGLFES